VQPVDDHGGGPLPAFRTGGPPAGARHAEVHGGCRRPATVGLDIRRRAPCPLPEAGQMLEPPTPSTSSIQHRVWARMEAAFASHEGHRRRRKVRTHISNPSHRAEGGQQCSPTQSNDN
jgi:hypothetical protein